MPGQQCGSLALVGTADIGTENLRTLISKNVNVIIWDGKNWNGDG